MGYWKEVVKEDRSSTPRGCVLKSRWSFGLVRSCRSVVYAGKLLAVTGTDALATDILTPLDRPSCDPLDCSFVC